MKCFYHNSDNDGFCSGAIVKYKYPKCELIGINYDDKVDLETIQKGEEIYMVDFSLSVNEMMDIIYKIEDFSKFNWMDHHKTSIQNAKDIHVSDFKNSKNLKPFNEICPGIREIGKAGCELTWEYLFPEQPIPDTVHFLGRYDVWDHKEPETLPFQYGIRLYDTNPNNQTLWSNLFLNDAVAHHTVRNIILEGTAILKYVKQENERYCKSGVIEFELDGYKCLGLNRMLTNSQIFESVWDNTKYDMMVTFSIGKEQTWRMSFYTDKEGVDCSKLASKFGGGGHLQAAGCVGLKKLPFKLIKE